MGGAKAFDRRIILARLDTSGMGWQLARICFNPFIWRFPFAILNGLADSIRKFSAARKGERTLIGSI